MFQGALAEMIGFMPVVTVAASVPPSISFISQAEITADQASYSFTSQSIDAADATRRVVVAVHWMYAGAGTDTVLNSATIGGVAATIHVQTNNGTSSSPDGIAIISALVPTGTTATIDLTFNATCSRAYIGVYSALNEAGSSPTATASDNTLTGSTLNLNLNVTAGGWLMAAVTESSNLTPTNTWTGVSENYDLTSTEIAGRIFSSGHTSGSAGGTPVTVTVVASVSLLNGAAASMSWA